LGYLCGASCRFCVEVAVGQRKNYWRGAHTILASTDMQHMFFGLSWPLLATNCYRRRTGIEYILHHILQPCRQNIRLLTPMTTHAHNEVSEVILFMERLLVNAGESPGLGDAKSLR
jgi:hypothetical protein